VTAGSDAFSPVPDPEASCENFYAFTVAEDVTKTSPTPEPGSLALIGLRRRFTGRA